MKYGYCRVSTITQARDGNSLEDQKNKLTEAGAEEIFVDAYTGTKIDRPQFSKLLEKLQEGDTLIVTKLDRISRSASQGIQLIDDLLEKGVAVNILNMGQMDNTCIGTLLRNVMFSFAQFERDCIVARTEEGRKIAMSKGVKFGRKGLDLDKLSQVEVYVSNGDSITAACKKAGISRAVYYKYKQETEE